MPAPEDMTPRLTPVEREIEAALAGALPAPAAFGPEQLAFSLGNAAANRRIGAWRTAAGVLAISLAVSIAVSVQQRVGPSAQSRTQPLFAHESSAPDASAVDPGLTLPRSVRSYAGLRSAVFSEGVEAIPAPPVGSAESLGATRPTPESGRTAKHGPGQVPPLIRSFLLIGGA